MSVHAANLYKMMKDGRCMRQGSKQYLATKKLVNDLQCAEQCNNYTSCSIFAIIKRNSSCMLYSGIYIESYQNLTYDAQGDCQLGLAEKQQVRFLKMIKSRILFKISPLHKILSTRRLRYEFESFYFRFEVIRLAFIMLH